MLFSTSSINTLARFACVLLPAFQAVAAPLPMPGSWTLDKAGPGLRAIGHEVAMAYSPGRADAVPPAQARITRVHAARRQEGNAIVASSLCWRSPDGPCVAMSGSQIDTHAFDGLAAAGPFVLVHTVLGWGGEYPPVFVRGSVTVWYE